MELARGGARFGTTEAIEKCLSTFLRGADLSVTAPSTVEQVLHAPPFATGRHQDLRVQRAVQCATGAAGSDELASTLGAGGGFGGAPKQELGVPSEAPTRFWGWVLGVVSGAGAHHKRFRREHLIFGPRAGVNIHGQSDFGAGGWQLREERLLQS